MIDFIIIPVILLALFKLKVNKDGFFEDYLSPENSMSLRGFFIVTVVLFHLTLQNLNVSYRLLGIFQGDNAVKIFFFLSGFGLVTQYKKKGDAYLKGFFSNRLIKLVIPFAIACIPYIFMYKHLGYYYTAKELNISTLFEQFFSHGYTIVYNSWFLIELIILYVVFFSSFKIAKGKLEKAVFYLTLITCVIMILFYELYRNGGWLYIWFYSIYSFAFGAAWAVWEEKLYKLITKYFYKIAIVTVPFVIILVFMMQTFLVDKGIEPYIMSKNLILGPFVIIGVTAGATKLKLYPKIWGFLGKISYEIFLLHGLFYTLLREYIPNDLLFGFAVLLGSIAVSIPVYYLDKLLIGGWLSLTGRKTKGG